VTVQVTVICITEVQPLYHLFLSPTLVRVRGFPPSKFIPRPFQPDVSRDPTNFVASFAYSHAALSDLLHTVKMVFNTLETCLDELDAWRLYLASV